MPLPIAIRPAREEDLPAIFDVFWDNEVGDRPDPPPRGDVPSFFRHELETGDMLVAEREGRVAGFASLVTRDFISYLAELFVRRDEHSSQIGKTLLHRILWLTPAVLPRHRPATAWVIAAGDECPAPVPAL